MLLNCGVGEKSLESPLDCKETQPACPKGNQSWMFSGKTDAETETLIFGHLMQRTDSLEKTLMQDGRWEEKGMTEDEMVGWHHWLNRYGFEKALGVGDGQGSLTYYKQSMGTQRVGHNWTTELNWRIFLSLVTQMVKNLPTRQKTWFNPWVWKIPWRKKGNTL